MKTMMRIGLLLAALASLAGCSKIKATTAPTAGAGSADFSRYVALGTSISAGWESGGLVDRHQRQAFPVLFAQAIGDGSFQIPSVNGDGVPALTRLVSLSPLVITNAGRVNGTWTNSTNSEPFDNLAVPYSLLVDVGDTTRYQIPPPTFPPYRPVMFTNIQRGRGSLLAQIATQMNPKPTFLTFEYGSNEVLGPASRGAGTVVPDAATFAVLLGQTLNALQGALPNAKVAIFTVPDVTTIPLVRTLPPVVLGANSLPIAPLTPVLGPGNTPVNPATDLLLLTAGPLLAAGMGYPVGTTSYMSGGPVPGTGVGLPDSVVLSGAEIASIRAATNGYNAAIVGEATARGFAVVDLKGLLETARSTGFNVAGNVYTSAFITGGLFSLDGVHPSDLAHGILCNALIASVNSKFGASIHPIDLSGSMTLRADRARLAMPESPLYPAVFQSEPGLASYFPWHGAPTP